MRLSFHNGHSGPSYNVNIFKWMQQASRYLILAGLFFTLFCDKSPYIEAKEISALTGKEVVSLLDRKAFQVSPQKGMENIALFQSSEGLVLALFAKEGGAYQLIRQIKLGSSQKFLKTVFLNTGKGYSHVLILTAGEKGGLHLADDHALHQFIAIPEEQLATIFIKKKNPDATSEYLHIGEQDYIFDSFAYIPALKGEPFPYLEDILYHGNESQILIRNRGGYTSRTVITLGFPDLTNETLKEHLGLPVAFPTVKLYPAGSRVYQKGGGRVITRYPIIEIIKEPFGNGTKMKLPLFLEPSAGRVSVRAVFYSGKNRGEWPASDLSAENIPMIKGQQGFYAYIYDPAVRIKKSAQPEK